MPKIFTMSELYGPHPCEEGEKPNRCGVDSFTVLLSDEDVAKLNEKLPEDVEDGMARGGSAAVFLLDNMLGKVLCDEHLKLHMPEAEPSIPAGMR